MKDKGLFVALLMGGMMVLLTIVMLTVVPAKIKKDVKAEIMIEMQRDYVPGPYTPGFDPDRVDPLRRPR